MQENSIIIFTNGRNLKFYRRLEVPGEKLGIYSCAKSIQILSNLNPDIILLDCGHQTKTGVALLKKINNSYPKIPIIFLTDMSCEDTVLAAFHAGAREYVKKPVTPVLLRDIVEHFLKNKRNSYEELSRSNLNYNITSSLSRYLNDDKFPVRLLDTLIFIDDQLNEQLNLTNLAQWAMMEKSYFTRYFKKYMGMSPMKYVNAQRIEYSKKLLHNKNLNITEIAYLAGFNDLNRFIRNFKRLNNISPTAYRKGLVSGKKS